MPEINQLDSLILTIVSEIPGTKRLTRIRSSNLRTVNLTCRDNVIKQATVEKDSDVRL